MTHRTDLTIEGIDLRNGDHDRVLSEQFSDAFWHSVDDLTVASVLSEQSGVDAVCDFANRLQNSVPNAKAIEVHPDIVGITDIGRRVEMSREAVRLWVSGERGPGSFPRAYCTLGSGSRTPIKGWLWADVNRWLAGVGRDDGFIFPTHAEAAQINSYLARVPEIPESWQRSRVQVQVPRAPRPRVAVHEVEQTLSLSFVAAEILGTRDDCLFVNGGSKFGLYENFPVKPGGSPSTMRQ